MRNLSTLEEKSIPIESLYKRTFTLDKHGKLSVNNCHSINKKLFKYLWLSFHNLSASVFKHKGEK